MLASLNNGLRRLIRAVFYREIYVGSYVQEGIEYRQYQIKPRFRSRTKRLLLVFILATLASIALAIFYVNKVTPKIDYDDSSGAPIYPD